jgi:hypothetical protein
MRHVHLVSVRAGALVRCVAAARRFRVAHALLCVGIALALAACAKNAASPSPISCFHATARRNSASTKLVFAARRCQGGGVTWAAILRTLAGRRGRLAPIATPTAGMTGDLMTLNGTSRLSIDEEGDASRLCSDDPALLASLRTDYERLNADAEELRRVMAETSPLDLECFGAGGGMPPMPAAFPLPTAPPEELAAARAGLDRIKHALQKEPAWCFPDDNLDGHKGVLRLAPDGRATHSLQDGKLLAEGTWSWPREGDGDDRIEVVLRAPGKDVAGGAGLLHLDVRGTGRLGYSYADPKIKRQDLIPGSICLAKR